MPGLETEFLTLFPHTVTLTAVESYDRNNEPTYGTPKTYRARITGKFISLRRSTTEDRTPIFDIYVDAGIDPITVDAKVELPGDPAWIDGTPIIFAIQRNTDDHGHHHVKIQCGWVYHRQGQ